MQRQQPTRSKTWFDGSKKKGLLESSAFKDEYFYKALFNTVFYLIGIPIGMVVSLLLAMAMNRNLPGTGIFRTIYYIPVISSLVAVSIIWGWIYNGEYGIINSVLRVFGIQGPVWIFDELWVKPAITIMLIWRGMGTSIILYLAGLQNIPDQYYEAAEIDGANGFQKMRHIILPLITPVSFFILVTSVIHGLQLFTEIQVMTPPYPSPSAGGTNFSAATIVFYLYRQAFSLGQMGYASAVAWFLGIVIFIATIFQFKLSNRWVNTMD